MPWWDKIATAIGILIVVMLLAAVASSPGPSAPDAIWEEVPIEEQEPDRGRADWEATRGAAAQRSADAARRHEERIREIIAEETTQCGFAC